MQLSFSRKAPWAVVTGVGIVCAACAARPAQAAHWDLTLEVTGNAHIESNGQVDNREANVFGQGGRRDPRASLSPQIVTTYNPDRTVTYTAQPATSQVDMDCVVVMTWTADPYRDGNTLPAPPDTASFLVTIGGLANNEFNGGPLVRSELELGDLFDAESIVRVQPAGGTTLLDGQHQEKDNFYVKLNDQSDERRIQSCSFLLQQATEGQSVVRWKAPHLKSLVHIAGGAMPNNNTQGSGGAYLSFIAVSDDRSLKLSRGGRYEYSKLVNGKWNTYGDSIYSARDASGFANNDRKTEVNITPSYITANQWGVRPDGTKPYITPKWVAQGFSSTYEQSPSAYKGYSKYGNLRISGGKYSGVFTGPVEFTTSYKATDTRDNATATAYYHLTLHDPVEPISKDEGDATSLEGYTIKSPAKDATGPLVYGGFRAADAKETTIRIGYSEEAGLDLTTTIGISLFKDMLGFQGEARLSSKKSISVDTEKKVPGVAKDMFVYLIASQPFQRKHVRFYMYDEGGKIKRFVTKDASGQVYPAFETYHEAIRDTALQTNYEWSAQLSINSVDINKLPTTVIPKPKSYDYS